MIKAWLLLLAAAYSPQLMATPEEIKPLVLFQGEVSEGTFLHMVEQGINEFEAVSSIPVVKKRLKRDNSLYLEEIEKGAVAGFSPIVVQDSNSIETFGNVAKANPATKFISLDVAYDVPNILGLTFNHAEGAYVIGFIAGLKTRTNHVGFIGAIDIPVLENFRCGYELGLKKANSNARLSTQYINNGVLSWDDLEKARALALQMVSEQVDIIFPVAGFASKAVMDTMKNLGPGHFSFGIDFNLNHDYPNTLLASFEKRSDKAIFAALMLLKNGIWNSNEKHFGIKQGIINVAVNQDNPSLSKKDKELISDLIIQLKGKNNAISREIITQCEIGR
ncbi:BMP family ABC transporter substrate-binding protein [Shewanella pealeana]|uniref:Basic membrane lipoprotein n=1 Tax=Shewanella pealeana (strain ATCC 700345 / ANG-SQ1) TaxID=398579 RepID=A8H653_SHEPA|nr:BMP family ABC transporter substrate-binding protein [Shewanella pealeana]ABV88040.1 basic membrane lipoprotein [Shewanella pealeana ATCC 700345]